MREVPGGLACERCASTTPRKRDGETREERVVTNSTFPRYLQAHTVTCERGHSYLPSATLTGPCPVCARTGAHVGLVGRKRPTPIEATRFDLSKLYPGVR